MKYFLLASLLVQSASAFVYHPTTTTTSISSFQRQRHSSLVVVAVAAAATTDDDDALVDPTYFEDLELAVHAVTKFGHLEPDVLMKLADKVEAGSDTCLFEIPEDLCEKEIADRKDVAEVLRMQAELKLRMDAIEGSSLFVQDVMEEALIRQRDEEMEILSEDGV